jgi:hypothetical protein
MRLSGRTLFSQTKKMQEGEEYSIVVDFSSLFSQQFCSSTSTILGEQTMF